MTQKIKFLIIIFFNVLIIFLLVDFFIGKKIEKTIFFLKIPEEKYQIGIKNLEYHHTLKKNLNVNTSYDIFEYKVCSNEYGMRISCEQKIEVNKNNTKNYDVMFIGDSFTFGWGLDYDETFVGIVQKKLKDLKIGNMGVKSYSPTLYYLKTKKFLEDNFKIKELIVFIDISDIEDEFRRFKIHQALLNNEIEDLNEITEKKIIDAEVNEKQKPKKNIKSILRNKFPFSYRLLFEIKNFYLPQPKYRYHYGYNRSVWSYDQKLANYDVQLSIESSIKSMDKLYELLSQNNIKLSVAVYPWVNNLLHDKKNSKAVKIWENFCKNKCYRFYNYFDNFFGSENKLSKQDALRLIKQYYLTGDTHFNFEGNKLIAEKIILDFIK